MDYQFKRLLDLVRRTGDRLVVTDPNGEDTYVLMGLEAYEGLADRLPSIEPEPWDKPRHFNDDFLDDYYDEDEDDDFDAEKFDVKDDWDLPNEMFADSTKNPSTPSAPSSPSTPSKAIWDVMPPAGDKSETWNPEKFDEVDKKVVEEKFENPEFPPKTDKKDEEDPGEEQFYLEPVE